MVAGGRPADSDSHERIRISSARTFLTAGAIGQEKEIILSVYHRLAFASSMRMSAFDKKLFSIDSCPILA
jgi:hypothetical protein